MIARETFPIRRSGTVRQELTFSKLKSFFPRVRKESLDAYSSLYGREKIQFFNSMERTILLGKGNHSMDLLLEWLSCESKRLERARYHNSFCKDEWEKTLTWEKSVIPQQNNSYDCGVYVIVFADFLSDDLAVSNVLRSTIVFYRKKIAFYILNGGIDSHELSFKKV